MDKKNTDKNLQFYLQNRQHGENRYDFRVKLFTERLNLAKNLHKRELVAHYGCVNAIEFSKEGQYLISGGDDRRVLFWNVDKAMLGQGAPVQMKKQHESNIFCLGFDNSNSRIYSGGNDDSVIVHDIDSGDALDVFIHTKPVYGLSIDPINDQIFATSGEDGRVLLFDLRASTEIMSVAKCRSAFHAVTYHPLDGNVLATANAKEGAALWDLRSPRMPKLRYGGDNATQSCMSVRFNTLGTQILALRRRLPPVLYNTVSTEPICQFYHLYYYNSCTMKSCSFGGEYDEYVLSGSDDFNLYVWKIGDTEMTNQWVDETHMVLYGHRSIVNQVRYNYQKCLIASSGVEKLIKVWTPFDLDGWSGGLTEEAQGAENPREVFTHEEYLSLVSMNGQNMSHDYTTNPNTNEDPRMMAFFDYLVQQEIEGWGDTLSQSSDYSSDSDSTGGSRFDSSQSSNAESLNNYATTTTRLSIRRNDKQTVQQRTRYRNRIAYLIATKRKKLKRLALKGSPRVLRRTAINKYNKTNKITKKKRVSHRTQSRKIAGKRFRKNNLKRPLNKDQTSDSETPKKSKKRRMQGLGITSYRNFRRKVKTPLSSTSNTSTRAADKSDTSTTDNDEDRKTPLPKHTLLPQTLEQQKLIDEELARARAEERKRILDVPSTSTGITSNGKNYMFRFNHLPDSDDDLSSSEINGIGLNHNHNNCPTSALTTDEETNFQNSSMNDDYVCSSRSNSRLSSSFQDEVSSTCTEEEEDQQRERNVSERRSYNHNSTRATNGHGPVYQRQQQEQIEVTPMKNNTNYINLLTPDSGIGGCSSNGSLQKSENKNGFSDMKGGSSNVAAGATSSGYNQSLRFIQKLSRVKKNHREFEETDSD